MSEIVLDQGSAHVSAPDPTVALQDQLAAALAQIENLRIALASSRQISAAVGIVMNQQRLSYDDAFAVLVSVSQRLHRKLRIVADDVVFTGALNLTAESA